MRFVCLPLVAVVLAMAGLAAGLAGGAASVAARGPNPTATLVPGTAAVGTRSAAPAPPTLAAPGGEVRPGLAEPVLGYGVIDTGVPDLPSALRQLGATLWYHYAVDRPGPGQAVVVRPDTNLETLAAHARAAPGGAYLVGNEPNLPEQDHLTPDAYADFLVRVATALRRADRAAILVGPNAVNWDYTCTACPGYPSAHTWSEQFLASYQGRYGPLPLDAWGMHVYDLDWSTLPLGRPESSQLQIAATRAWLDARGLALPIWITEMGVIWGYEGARFVDTPSGPMVAPVGPYRTDLLVDYINGMFGWLESRHAALRIERAYLFSTVPVREPWALVPGGIGLFEPNTGTLTPMGQAYRAWALRSSMPTPAPCAPRPPIQVTTVARGDGRLQVTVAAQSGSGSPLQALRFGSTTNAVIELGGDGRVASRVSRDGNFSVTLPPDTTQVAFLVHQVASGSATTVPFVVLDGCGDWPTLVGGGPQAFSTSSPGATTPVPTPPPPSGGGAATHPPPVACSPRPPVQVSTAPSGAGQLQVTVAASGAGISLQALRFGAATNARVEAGGQSGSRSFAVSLAPGTQQTTFTVTRLAAGQPVTVTVVVVDSCGEWPTVVGGGAQAW